MKQSSFSATAFVAVVSILLFSGQQRPYSPPQQRPPAQTQQRQPVQPVQRQATPPKPAAAPAKQPPPKTETEMSAFYLLLADTKFPEMPPGASPTITLFGDPKSEGLYVTRTLIPKGVQTIPHIHTDFRTVTVLSGICYYSRGDEFDESEMIPMPPGTFFTEPAGIPHSIWAKDDDVIVQTTAIGPSGTQIVPEKKSNNGTASSR